MTSNIVLQGLSGGQTLVTQGYGGTAAAAPPTPAPTVGGRRTITWPPIRTKEDLLRPEKPTVEVIPQPLLEGMTFEELVAYAKEMLAPLEVAEEDFQRILEPLIPPQEREESAEEKLRVLLASLPKLVNHKATVEDFQRILKPLIQMKRREDDEEVLEATLRDLLSDFKLNGELFENGLREILRNMKLKEKN